MEDMTNKEMLKIMLKKFDTYKDDWDQYKNKQDKVNDIVIRHDEQIKSQSKRIDGMWKIPIISGGIVTLIGGISAFITILSNVSNIK